MSGSGRASDMDARVRGTVPPGDGAHGDGAPGDGAHGTETAAAGDVTGLLDSTWPEGLPPLPGCRIVALRFDPADLAAAPAGIALPEALARAATRRRGEYIAGRLCAREALALLSGRAALAPSMSGDRIPVWPGGVVGAITHSDGSALALVGPSDRYRGLGVDLEHALRAPAAENLSALILTGEERARWSGGAATGPDPVLVATAFSLKESLFKALCPRTGHRYGFGAAELTEWHPDGRATLRLRETLGEECPEGLEIAARHTRFRGQILTCVAIEREGSGGRSETGPD